MRKMQSSEPFADEGSRPWRTTVCGDCSKLHGKRSARPLQASSLGEISPKKRQTCALGLFSPENLFYIAIGVLLQANPRGRAHAVFACETPLTYLCGHVRFSEDQEEHRRPRSNRLHLAGTVANENAAVRVLVHPTSLWATSLRRVSLRFTQLYQQKEYLTIHPQSAVPGYPGTPVPRLDAPKFNVRVF